MLQIQGQKKGCFCSVVQGVGTSGFALDVLAQHLGVVSGVTRVYNVHIHGFIIKWNRKE